LRPELAIAATRNLQKKLRELEKNQVETPEKKTPEKKEEEK